MLSTGIDLIEIERIAASLINSRFIPRVFGEYERLEIAKKGEKAEHYAACFSAKEAFAKSLRTGVRGFAFHEVELLHDSLGAPYLRLSGNAKRIAEEKNLRFSISITHTARYAAAFCVAYN